MPLDLYLIVTEFESGLKHDPFCRIKTSDGLDGGIVVGFKSETLAKDWATMKELAGWGLVVCESALTSQQLSRLKESKILLLETPEDVHACAKNWASFNFASHVLPYAAVKSKLAARKGAKDRFFLLGQIFPPLLMCALLIGFFRHEFIIFVGLPLLYSAFRVVMLLYKRRFSQLLRPALTIILSLIVINMWRNSANDADLYVQHLAREIQSQCNHDQICKVPHGKWVPESDANTEYILTTPGVLPTRIKLSFDDYIELESQRDRRCAEKVANASCHDIQINSPFATFRLAEIREDSYPPIYGGVGRSLHTSRSIISD